MNKFVRGIQLGEHRIEIILIAPNYWLILKYENGEHFTLLASASKRLGESTAQYSLL